MSIKNHEEQFILSRMVNDDQEAFRFFFDKYYTELCNIIDIYLGNPEVSEEIVEDIFVWFWENRKNVKIGTSVKAYLFTACKNKMFNYLRHQKMKRKIHAELSINFEDTFDEIPEAMLDSGYLREIIQRSLDSLPPQCRKIFLLAKEEELSYKQIAGELNISVKTVENQMGKALKTLRSLLRPYFNKLPELFLILVSAFVS